MTETTHHIILISIQMLSVKWDNKNLIALLLHGFVYTPCCVYNSKHVKLHTHVDCNPIEEM